MAKAKTAAPRHDFKGLATRSQQENQILRGALANVASLIERHFGIGVGGNIGVGGASGPLPMEHRETHLGMAHRAAIDALRTPIST